MRYFKYDHPKTTEKEIYKVILDVVDDNERKLLKKSNFLNKLAILIFAVVTISLLIVSFIIAKSFAPEYENLLQFLILVPISQFGIFALGAIATFLISALIAIPIFNASSKLDKRLKKLRRERLHEISSKACEHIVEFYGLHEPSIVTKCYDSTERRFKSQDVRILNVAEKCEL
jgi:uncharacterized protein YacL